MNEADLQMMRRALAWMAKHDTDALDTYWHGTLTECRVAMLRLTSQLAAIHDEAAAIARDESQHQRHYYVQNNLEWEWDTFDHVGEYSVWLTMHGLITDHFHCHCGEPANGTEDPLHDH